MKNKLALCLLAASFGTFALSSCGNNTTNTPPPPTETPSYTIGGKMSGLGGGSVVLQLNGQETVTMSAAGTFTFNTKVLRGNTYAVTVKTQPSQPPQTCDVFSGSGTVTSINVTSVEVVCKLTTYPVNVMVMGLNGATGLVLQNNGGDDLTINVEGTFTFSKEVPEGGNYNVTVKTQPVKRACTVTSGSGVATKETGISVNVNCLTTARAETEEETE
ncbi:MAG TPA: hypothetical protein PKE31_08135 [Pseudomonadota bacterium]|nr:hypothetical protein [Pseudomonadota bacterium]